MVRMEGIEPSATRLKVECATSAPHPHKMRVFYFNRSALPLGFSLFRERFIHYKTLNSDIYDRHISVALSFLLTSVVLLKVL